MIIKKTRFAAGTLADSSGVLGSFLHGGRSLATKCRQLARTCGIAPVFILTAVLLLSAVATPARADTALGQMHFTVVAVSDAGVREGVHHRMALNGDGKFGPEHVEGGGTFVLFD